MTGQASVLIREAVLPDVVDLTELMNQLGHPTDRDEMESRMEVILADPTYHTLVAHCDEKIVGMIGLAKSHFYEANGDYVRIVALVVDEGQRSHGIGQMLVQAGEQWARGAGASAVMLNSNRKRLEAHRFYERLGYEAGHLGFQKTLTK
jgi:GNAT superfamily N-acetyltransferase